MGAIVLFVFAKFAAYSVFCAQAPRWFAFPEPNSVSFGVRWGTARLLIGIAAGVPIAFIFAMAEDAGLPVFLNYAVSFVPTRYLEWLLLFLFFRASRELPFGVRANAWILMGVAVSLAFDLVAWTVLEFSNVNLKFFC